VDRTLARQKELMDTVFGGIGEETKPEKRMGLAMQQADVEQRHALRLLLLYREPVELTRHLQRCLDEPAYGYGERGWNGRTLAQAMAAVSEGDELGQVVAWWLESHREFQAKVLDGAPFLFLSMFESDELDSFAPFVQRVAQPETGQEVWRLGVEGEGKYRDFPGSIEQVWADLADTYVTWNEEDNEQWLTDLKQRAARQTPDSIFRAARADKLRRERDRLERSEAGLILTTEKEKEPWPRTVVMKNETDDPLLAVSRLSGHNFYELSWNGGLNTRRFELSGTTRKRVPFEHIEIALWLAETLGAELGLTPEPVSTQAVEAAYLRRMKAGGVALGPPTLTPDELPKVVKGRPVAGYQVDDIMATLLAGDGPDLAWISRGEQGVLLQQDVKRGVVHALPAQRGRPRRGQPLMTTPLAELDMKSSATRRALLAWGCWLLWATHPQKKKGKQQEAKEQKSR
jgi:hypothetical protein